MKKTIFFLLLFLFFEAIATAQDCKMCGDWIGTYTISIPDPEPDGGMIDQNMKMLIRIKQYGDDMSIRVKTFPVNEPNDIKYWPDCEITNATDNSISFTSSAGDSFDWDNNDRKNGRVINKASYYCMCILDYRNGKIVLSRHFHVDYYDRYNSYIDGRDYGYETISLYQEDDDW